VQQLVLRLALVQQLAELAFVQAQLVSASAH
jgi:hypothetical protein